MVAIIPRYLQVKLASASLRADLILTGSLKNLIPGKWKPGNKNKLAFEDVNQSPSLAVSLEIGNVSVKEITTDCPNSS